MNEVIGKRTRRQGRIRALVASVLLTGTVVVGFNADHASAAGVPVFPDNLVIFPDRDFLSAEGFDGHVGENALVQVIRGVEVIGAAEVTLEPGGVPFEVNHPGGYCWGNDVIGGTGFSGPAAPGDLPDVTPDIRPGDDIVLTFADGTTSEITTQDGYVAEAPENGTVAEPAVSGVDTVVAGDADFIPGFESRFTIRGRINTADPTFVEQRIVNPDLTDTAVGRRDIRAVPDPLDPLAFAPDGNDTYMSNLLVDDVNDTFVATYLFRDVNIATTAATGGGERLLTWQATDLNANRQGITIAEFGEVGGPGFGGCPNGPLQSGPPGPANVLAAVQGNGDIIVNWDPAVEVPGTPPIVGYRVDAVARTSTSISTWTEQIEIGRRITGQQANGTTITGLSPTEFYDVYVVSVNDLGLATNPAIHAIPVIDLDPPVVTANPPAGTYAVPQEVTLSSNELGDIYYTTDGSLVYSAGSLADNVILYDGTPIAIADDTTVNVAAFDPSGNVGEASFGYTITNTPAAPTFGSATVGQGSINVTWTDVPTDPSITEYTVTIYDSDTAGNVVGSPRVIGIAESTGSTTFAGLDAGTPYWATIMAANSNGYGAESARLGPLTPQGAVVADAGADQQVARGSTVTLDGTASSGVGITFSWVQTDPADPVIELSNPTVGQPTFTFPSTQAGPVTFELTVSDGTSSDTDTVTISAIAAVADAGPDQDVVRGSTVNLDGTASSGVGITFSWVQTDPADPVIELSNPTVGQPTFTFPSTQAGPVTFELTVSDGVATSTDTVTISPLTTDPLALNRAEYRISKNQWRFDGSASVLDGDDITIRLNQSSGGTVTTTVLDTGPVPVDTAGLWTVRFNPTALQQPIQNGSSYTVTITSSKGGLLLDAPITTKR